MKAPSKTLSRRKTGIWKLTNDQGQAPKQVSPLEEQLKPVDVAYPDQNNSTIEFGGIRVKLVTYKTIPRVILINAAKTMSEWMKLRALNHPNIIGFDDNDSRMGH
jgi:hypothetical protein